MIFDAIKNLKDNFKKEPIVIDMDEASAKSVIEQYNNLKLGADAFIEKTGLSDEVMKSYLHTVESGNATFQGCTQYVNSTSNSIGLMGIKAKATSLLINGLKAATGMLVTALLAMAIGKIIEGLDNLIHRKERIAEAAETAKNKINELTSEGAIMNINDQFMVLACKDGFYDEHLGLCSKNQDLLMV